MPKDLEDYALAPEAIAQRKQAARERRFAPIIEAARAGNRDAQISCLQACVVGSDTVPNDVRQIIGDELMPLVWDKLQEKRGRRKNPLHDFRLALALVDASSIDLERPHRGDTLVAIATDWGSSVRSLQRIEKDEEMMRYAGIAIDAGARPDDSQSDLELWWTFARIYDLTN